MKKGHVVLAALATVVGFGTAFGVDAASYRDIGTVADGVYLLEGDGAFKVSAIEPVTAIVYDQEGALLLAKALGSGEARTFVVGEGAVAAILGGDAKVAARNGGRMMPLETTRNIVELAENSGPMDERFSVRLPPFLVGLTGKVQGEAEGLVVEVSSSKGLIYRHADGAAEVNLGNLAAEVMDARIAADRLDGRIVLEVHQPDFGMMEWAFANEEAWDRAEAERERHQAQHEAEKERHQEKERQHHAEAAKKAERARAPVAPEAWTPSVEDLAAIPTLLRFDTPGMVTFDLETGHGLDLTLYDAMGAPVQYLQRGMTVQDSRAMCGGFLDCFAPMGSYDGYEELPPESFEWVLDPGEYVLFIRLAGAEGTFAFQGLAEHTEIEPVQVDGNLAEAETLAFDTAVLDFWVHSWNPSVQSEVVATLNGATFYTEHSTANLFGQALEHEVTYDPSLLGSGTLELMRSGLTLPGEGAYFSVLIVPSPNAAEDRDN